MVDSAARKAPCMEGRERIRWRRHDLVEHHNATMPPFHTSALSAPSSVRYRRALRHKAHLLIHPPHMPVHIVTFDLRYVYIELPPHLSPQYE